jgi:cytochrome c553
MRSRRTRGRCLGALCLGAGLAATGPAAEPRSPLALSCTGCHQPRVNSREMPALDRRTPQDIVAALRRSRDAPTPGSIMARFTVKLTDAQIESLARELGRPAPR